MRTNITSANRDVELPSEDGRSRRTLRLPVGLDWGVVLAGLLTGVGYYAGALIGFAFTFQPHPVSVMWPPNSILMAAFLLTSPRHWWLLLLAAFPAHMIAEVQAAVPLKMVLCWFVSNASEALIGAASARYLLGGVLRFDSLQNLGVLFFCGGILGPFLSSFLDSALVSLNQFGNENYWQVWRMRFCSNVFTGAIVVPVIVTWGTRRLASLRAIPRPRLIEAGAVFVGLLTVSFVVFQWQPAGPATIPALLYAPLPFLLWAAVRFGPAGTSTAILSVALLAIWGAVHERGPFASESAEQNALSIQFFFSGVSLALMFLATSVAERGRAEERFTKAFRSSPDAMLISRLKDGRVIEVNDRWEKLLGYASNETVGQSIFDLNVFTSEANHERFLAAISAADGFHLELCLRAKSGNLLHVLVSGDTDEIGGEHCWIFAVRDITDRKRAEEAQQNLAHASRLAVVGELTAMVAHEVNQPLGAILSNAEAAEILLKAKEPKLDEVRQILSDIRKNDLRADEAIRRIRALLRKREMLMEPLDLNETVADVLRLASGDALGRHVQIRKALAPNLPPVSGDRIHLQQVLLNLIVNAMDAMATIPDMSRCLTVETRRDDHRFVEVAVADSGPGIPPDKMARIFDSFFTTKQEGMGLGLSIARSIIEAHRGRIWAENDLKGGARFRFTVPVAQNMAGQALTIVE